MLPTNTSRTGRRSLAALAVAACGLVPACSGDDNDSPDDAPADTLAQEDVIDQAPGASSDVNDVSDGSGEGGNRSEGGEPATGTAAP